MVYPFNEFVNKIEQRRPSGNAGKPGEDTALQSILRAILFASNAIRPGMSGVGAPAVPRAPNIAPSITSGASPLPTKSNPVLRQGEIFDIVNRHHADIATPREPFTPRGMIPRESNMRANTLNPRTESAHALIDGVENRRVLTPANLTQDQSYNQALMRQVLGRDPNGQ